MDTSKYKNAQIGSIEKILFDMYNHEGYEMRKMRIRSVRPSINGDMTCNNQRTIIGAKLAAADFSYIELSFTLDVKMKL